MAGSRTGTDVGQRERLRGAIVATRVTRLGNRVTALESALSKQPAGARPSCGMSKFRSVLPARFCIAAFMCLATAPAIAETTILKCDFSNLPEVHFTIYDDG